MLVTQCQDRHFALQKDSEHFRRSKRRCSDKSHREYDLDGPKDATLVAGQDDEIDIKLKPARDLGAQITNAERLISRPGRLSR
jgi:hypothetical protein